ncbi:MMPL family transporter [Xylanimonas ulmi]|uniref:RND superfamily putative drug exporter n=1 Tax=Xylanimonas ulmi TaxID=228973 RepID=A0A4Q7M297_9MICO|nr:MMPL family transporter [Xylanibacterium ulmi]RZS60029.1 RND superfamily putative drug exporter [Xylanibacterium ulmi]
MSALARWSVRHRFVVVGIWLLLFAGAGVGVLTAGNAFTDETSAPGTESSTAYALLADAGAGATKASAGTAKIVWHVEDVPIDDPWVVQQVDTLLAEVAEVDGIESVLSPYDDAGAAQLSTETGTAYATLGVADGADTAAVTELVDTFDESAGFDAAAWGSQFHQSFGGAPVELIGVVAALLVLLLVFRSAWAAVLPIATGVAGVALSALVVMLGSHVIDLSSQTTSMGSLIGLGVGIDYALFIVNRHRKALLRGKSVEAAAAEAISTSGRAVIFAGGTVIVALLGLLVLQVGILSGMAVGAAITVALTVASAVTLLPAFLGFMGHRVLSRKQRRALPMDSAVTETAGGVFARWAATVGRRPVAAAVTAGIVMLTLAVPALSIRLGSADASSDPVSSATNRFHVLMADGFGEGFDSPLLLVAQTPDDAARTSFDKLASEITDTPGVASVAAAPTGPDQQIAVLTVTPTTTAQDEGTARLVDTLRSDVIPDAESGTRLQVYVGGTTASNVDFAQLLTSKLPLYLAIIATLGFLLLVLAFRSIVVPLVGALSNLLTMAVSLGAVTAAFQWGWLSGLLGVGGAAPIEPLVPVVVVGIVFGLSMDYQVFLVSRIHEEWSLTRDNHRAIQIGMSETGHVIAAAATIMFLVFASFGTIGFRIIAEMGIGMAVAILADAFIVRLGLMPALMHLIGPRNWWFPRWADRITPQVSIEGEHLSRTVDATQPLATSTR